MNLWRIATETRSYSANDLSGGGAAHHPGRWNAKGEAVVYTAQALSLAVLETAAYVDSAGLPYNRFVVRIEVPESVWDSAEKLDTDDLPGGWDAVPAGMTSVAIGSRWLEMGKSALLVVPSVIVPEESAVLINPSHSDASKILAVTGRKFFYNSLFRSP